jgi:hypothetical protein
MGEFGYKPKNISLLDAKLTLDPETIRIMEDIEAQMAARRILSDILNPNWSLLMPDFQSILASPSNDIFKAPAIPGAPPAFKPGAGPDKPRAGELSDITKALYQLPAVQGLMTRAHDEGLHHVRLLKKEWDTAPTVDRVIMVSMATVFAGSLITPIVANQQTRDLAFGLIKGKDIPIPGVDGLSFKILDSGGGIKAPLGVPGLTGSAQMQFPHSGAPNYEFNVSFDVIAFIKSRSSK